MTPFDPRIDEAALVIAEKWADKEQVEVLSVDRVAREIADIIRNRLTGRHLPGERLSEREGARVPGM